MTRLAEIAYQFQVSEHLTSRRYKAYALIQTFIQDATLLTPYRCKEESLSIRCMEETLCISISSFKTFKFQKIEYMCPYSNLHSGYHTTNTQWMQRRDPFDGVQIFENQS